MTNKLRKDAPGRVELQQKKRNKARLAGAVAGVGPVSGLTFDTSNAHRSGSSPTWRSSIQQVRGGLGRLFAGTRLKPGIFNARTKERVG